jgi:long-chain acyl-CoA synthetase
MMLVHNFLHESARRLPNKKALIFQDRSFTYREILSRVSALKSFLLKGGLKKGDRVGIYLENSPEAVVSIFAVLSAGGCFSIINPTIKAKKLAHIMQNSDPRFLIATSSQMAIAKEALKDLKDAPKLLIADQASLKQIFEGEIDNESHNLGPRIIDNDLASIIYTSGSTGNPKGVTMTHRNMYSAATAITTYLENREDDIILNMLPFSFDYGLYQLLMTFKIGGTLVLEKGFGYPFQVIELIKKEKITGLPCVPTMFAILLQMENLEKHNLDSVRYITNTAAQVPRAYITRLQSVFPNARIYSMYGLTECKRVSYLPPNRISEKPDSVGIPMQNLECWIEDDNGEVLPAGKVGELVVRGASVMQCYWNDPKSTSAVLRTGPYPFEKKLYTGDLFRMDDEGYLYFIARKDDLIKSRGERIAPKEIEDVIIEIPEVLAVRVIGVPDDIFGQAIKAEIVLKDGCQLQANAVKTYCRNNLEDLMVPHLIEFVKELPLSESGKIKRKDY